MPRIEFSGVRPSPGAATCKVGDAHESPTPSGRLELAAPGDGRTPPNSGGMSRPCSLIMNRKHPGLAILLALLLLNILAAIPCHAQAGWQLSWSDEFNGTSINPSNWAFDTGTGPPFPGWGNNELEYYTSRSQNAYVTNGLLHIVARQESFGGSSYTSAKMKTSGL